MDFIFGILTGFVPGLCMGFVFGGLAMWNHLYKLHKQEK